MTITYTVDHAKLPAYKRKSVVSTYLLYGSLGLITLAFINRGNFSTSGLISLAVGLGVQLLVISLLCWASIRTFTRQANSLRIVVDDETISREVAGMPPLTVRRTDVTLVEEYPGNGLLLRTANPRDRLYLSELLDNFEPLRAELTGHLPVVRKQTATQLLLRCIAWSCVPVVLMLSLSWLSSRPAVIALGSIIVVGAAGLAVYMQRIEAYPRWYKIVAWLFVPLVLVLVLQRLNALG